VLPTVMKVLRRQEAKDMKGVEMGGARFKGTDRPVFENCCHPRSLGGTVKISAKEVNQEELNI